MRELWRLQPTFVASMLQFLLQSLVDNIYSECLGLPTTGGGSATFSTSGLRACESFGFCHRLHGSLQSAVFTKCGRHKGKSAIFILSAQLELMLLAH